MVCRLPKPPKPRVEVAESQRSAASSQSGEFATRLLAVDYDIIKHDLHRFPRNSQYRSQQHPNTLRWACRLAAFAGSFATRNMLGEANENYKKYYRYFSNRRHFAFPSGLVKIIGKPLVSSLSNSWAKFYQVDHHRKHD
jgi:hypothetical protein